MAESAEVLALPAEDGANPLRPQPGEVWSLWDMLKFDASSFFAVSGYLHRLQGSIEQGGGAAADEKLEQHDSVFLLSELRNAHDHVKAVGAEVTAITISETIESIANDCTTWSYKEIGTRCASISSTLRRELSLISLFVLERERIKYFAADEPLFGKEVELAFPTAAYEIDEAGKCLALSRPTAAVFHLMRIVEIALKSVAKCLSIPDPTRDAERNWGVILKKIKDEKDRRGSQWCERTFFADVYASLDAVRVSWRNSTMHVESKYTEDEAEHIWIAVKGLMRKLAARCDEQGQPLA